MRRIRHYNSSQKILLVGEGDFSFSACLAKTFRSGQNMVSTCCHSYETLLRKHWTSYNHLVKLENLGCLVVYEVDVYEMNKHPTLKDMKFDVIIFNFPHAGHYDWLCERDEELIEMHKELVVAYFKSAKEMLCEDGEVHVTLRDDDPYHSWDVENIANKGLRLKEKTLFLKTHYPGYHNKRGGDIDCNKTFPLYACFTFKFILDHPLKTTTNDEISLTNENSNVEVEGDEDDDRVFDNDIAISEIVAGVSDLIV